MQCLCVNSASQRGLYLYFLIYEVLASYSQKAEHSHISPPLPLQRNIKLLFLLLMVRVLLSKGVMLQGTYELYSLHR